MPFLTELDPRLAVRGSRDPLAAQAVWSTLGRRLVGNLTLASADVAGFRTLLLGYLLAEKDRRDPLGSLQLFLRWEQACAYARVATRYEDAPSAVVRRGRGRSPRTRSNSGTSGGTRCWATSAPAACGPCTTGPRFCPDS